MNDLLTEPCSVLEVKKHLRVSNVFLDTDLGIEPIAPYLNLCHDQLVLIKSFAFRDRNWSHGRGRGGGGVEEKNKATD